MKKVIKVNFVDFWSDFDIYENDFVDILKDKYEVVISDQPDYLFYSSFGSKHLNYDCIRIFYTGECLTPNFNECDYAIGFDRLSFGDRYIRIPLYKLFHYQKEYLNLIYREKVTVTEISHNKDFCSFVYSNCFAQDARAIFYDKLSEYKSVSSGGRYKNNIGGAIRDKKAFQAKHKFAIAFENTCYDGYCTEKIMEAFAAGCVPIYYGDPKVIEDFNPESFINVHDYNSFDTVIEKIKELDNDDVKYLAMRNANPVEGRDVRTHLEKFLFNIFEQELNEAFRRPFSIFALNREKAQLRHVFFETYIYEKFVRRLINVIGRFRKGAIISKKQNQ